MMPPRADIPGPPAKWGPGIIIDLGRQRLSLREADGREACSWSVSTARHGAGEEMDSYRTPRGRHVIAERIGTGCAPNTVFVGRRPTGEIYTPDLGRAHPERDWILTRILWLQGLEAGVNLGGNVDTKRRHIYIHGTPDQTRLGVPGSIGCVRMANDAIIALYDAVDTGTPVWIIE